MLWQKWLDATDIIITTFQLECVLKNTFLFIQTVYEGQELNHPFGLCHYKNLLFWNEYRSGGIYKLDQNTKKATLLRSERPPIYEIRTYDAQQQQSTEHPEHFFWKPYVNHELTDQTKT